MSTRLKAILEIRRNEALLEMRKDDEDMTGNRPTVCVRDELGEASKSFKRAWQRAVLVAHGHRPEYRKAPRGKAGRLFATATLTSESLATLQTIGLHFHDLRREAGSGGWTAPSRCTASRSGSGTRTSRKRAHTSWPTRTTMTTQ